MDFLKKHHSFIITSLVIIICVMTLFWIKHIFNTSQKNFQDIASYSEWLIVNDEEISFNNVITDNFELSINGKAFHKWNTLNSFNEALKSLLKENAAQKIYVNIYNDDEQIKTTIFKYSDFWYLIDTKWILSKVKTGIIKGDKGLNVSLSNHIFFDDKLLNKEIDKIKDSFTETSNGEIYFSKESQTFKVNSNKVFLSSVEDVKLNIANIKEDVNLRDSAIDIYLSTEENVFFDQVEKLNTVVGRISQFAPFITYNLEGLDYSIIKDAIYSLDIELLELSTTDNNFKISYSQGFLTDYLTFDYTTNKLQLDEEKFDKTFWELRSLRIENIDDELVEKPSLYEIKVWGISENKPNSNHFGILSYGDGISFDYVWFKKNIKILIDKATVGEISENENSLINMFKASVKSKKPRILVENIDNTYSSKDEFTLTKGMYKNGDYLLEKYINYGKYPFQMKEKDNGYNSCYIESNIELYCDEWLLMWKLWYDWESIILKEPYEKLFESLELEDFWTKKKNWNVVFTRDNVSMYYGWLYNNISIKKDIYSIIQDYKTELFPNFLWDYVEGRIEYDKVIFSIKLTDPNSNILIKSDEYLENDYIYVFKVDIEDE